MCIPAYRAEPFLRPTIESVLAQTYVDWELVIVDNASPDGTGEVARSYRDPRIVVHTNPATVPLADNWNRAVGLCRGRLVKLLPADDRIRPECLELQVKAMDDNPGTALVACRRDLVDADGRVLAGGRGLRRLDGPRPAVEVIREILRSGINPVGEPGGWLFRREDFERVGGFDPALAGAVDLDLATRLLVRGDLVGLSDTLAQFTVRGDSYTAHAVRAQLAEHRRLLRRLAADRRWPVSRPMLWWALGASGVAAAKRSLLYRASDGRLPVGRTLLALWSRRAQG